MKFQTLCVGHRPCDPAEATLVLAAVAAFCGVRCDGDPMPDAHPRSPSLREIAGELGLHVGAVRRGMAHLVEVGAVTLADGELHVDPAALRDRWAEHRCRLRITEEARGHGLRAEPLLLVGLVAGQLDQRGRLVLGRRWLAERLGWQVASGRTKGAPSGRLDTALRSAEKVGALHTWTIPGSWQFCLALGPSRIREREASRTRDSEEAETPARRETAKPPVAKPQRPRRETAKGGSRIRESNSEYPPEYPPDQPSGARAEAREAPAAPARVETRPEQPPADCRPAVVAPPARATTPQHVREAVEAWRVEHRHLDELSAANAMHAVAVALLLERLGWNVPDDLHDGSPRRQVSREHALRRARMRDAANLCRWAASADTLATWILRAVAEHGPDNLCAYLRKASAQGDPGTLLHSTKHNEIGRGAESVSDYGASTERELEGAYATQVAQLTEGGAAVMGALDPVQRARLRGQLAKLMQLGRTDGARRVLLQLVGDHPSDITLARAVDGICTVAEARRLIA